MNHLGYKNKRGGFLVLTLIILVMATVAILATGSLLRSIGKEKNSSDSGMSAKALGAVNACGEYALLQMATTSGGKAGWNFASTTGSSLVVGEEICYIYPVIDGDNDSKIIMASSTVSNFTRKIKIEVATNTPQLIVNYWWTVADF